MSGKINHRAEHHSEMNEFQLEQTVDCNESTGLILLFFSFALFYFCTPIYILNVYFYYT